MHDEDIVNWEDIKRTVKRKDYGAVTRTFTDTFEFCGGMYSRLIGILRVEGRNAGGKITVETLGDNWAWNKLFDCELDFSTIKITDTKISIGCMDNSLTSLINANKSTKYDLGNIADPKKLYYDRVIRYPGTTLSHDFAGDIYSGQVYQQIGKVRCVKDKYRPYTDIAFIPVAVGAVGVDSRVSLFSVSGGSIDAAEINSNGEGIVKTSDIKPFIIARKHCVVRVKINVSIAYTGGLTITYYNRNAAPRLVILRTTPDRSNYGYTMLSVPDLIPGVEFRSGATMDIFKIDADVDLNASEGLILAILTPAWRSNGSSGAHVGEESTFKIWSALPYGDYGYREGGFSMKIEIADEDNLFFDPFQCQVIKPQLLLDTIVKKIAGDSAKAYIEADTGSVLDNTLLIPADYLRGVSYLHARVSASYKDFADWMLAVFGYIPFIDDEANTVTFRHRDSFFRDEVVTVISNISRDVELTYNDDFDYAAVEVGYKKKDYEKRFGRDEWRWLTQYTTGVSSSDKTLQLVSPWRSDAYGMEYVSAERRRVGDETVDDKSDNDMFFVCAALDTDDGMYHFVREGYSVSGLEGNASTMFNAMFSPYFMVKANERYLASVASTLKYASCDGNTSAAVYVGTLQHKVSDDIALSNPLFSIQYLSLTTDTYDEVNDWQGLVSVTFAGHDFVCYVDEVEQNPGKESSTSYKLIVKSMTLCS